MLFSIRKLSPLQVIYKTNCAYAAFMEATRRTQRAAMGTGSISGNHGNLNGTSQTTSIWSAPDLSWFKVNVDASWNPTTKKGNVATMIRDSNGGLLLLGNQALQLLGFKWLRQRLFWRGVCWVNIWS